MAMPTNLETDAVYTGTGVRTAPSATSALRLLGGLVTGLFAARMFLTALLVVYFLIIAPDQRASLIALVGCVVSYLMAFGVGGGLRAGERLAALFFVLYAVAMLGVAAWLLVAFRESLTVAPAWTHAAGILIWPVGAWANPLALLAEVILVIAGGALVVTSWTHTTWGVREKA